MIDRTWYPIDKAGRGNMKWRPVGLGMMGLQDVFFKLNLPFDSEEAKRLQARIAEEIYYHALKASLRLSRRAWRPRDLPGDARRRGSPAV